MLFQQKEKILTKLESIRKETITFANKIEEEGLQNKKEDFEFVESKESPGLDKSLPLSPEVL
jgi:hypothetical protein